ncbi:MAG TPA: histidine phosphatase family protein [Puia sp.]|nr:histidine phosphatase family protein [Puia sp.]
MKLFTGLLIISLFLTSCSQTYYIVRHAEKDTSDQTAKDPSLTEAGKQRAEKLKEILKDENITNVFATNTVRAKSTAQPTADYFHINIEQYSKTDSAFFAQLKKIKKNVLIIGHSNTVKNIVNGLCNKEKLKADLKDDEFDNLFTVKYKRFFGLHIKFARQKY